MSQQVSSLFSSLVELHWGVRTCLVGDTCCAAAAGACCPQADRLCYAEPAVRGVSGMLLQTVTTP
jgi:hypothetical protein